MRRLVLVLAFSLSLTGCATLDVKLEHATRDAIAQSEQNRCTVHPAPCLSEGQFRSINADLYKASVVGADFTRAYRAGTAQPADIGKVIAAVNTALSNAQGITSGGVQSVIASLEKALQYAQSLAQKVAG